LVGDSLDVVVVVGDCLERHLGAVVEQGEDEGAGEVL
jgi:hypothetical protein